MRFPGQGVAAIVGPNGCGKSNLSDAISWVLGEQSAKSLRGTRMEDVIFAGTRDRKPLGMAQVSMTLVDPTGKLILPSEKLEASKAAQAAETTLEGDSKANGHSNGLNGHSNGHTATLSPEKEIIVTRRLFRSGESEYLINGRTARLRDIQEIFMGTGLGPESYAIIEQGRIGQILSSKPLDRRAVIEEAAGISKFKTKRRLAEAKLEGARQNLTRVFDILEEVTRQVNSLKRQAGKAKRYEELKKELDVWLRNALTGRDFLLQREIARIRAALAEASARHQELTTSVAEGEKALAAARETFYQLESDLTQARQKSAEISVDSERTRGQIEAQKRQVASIEQRLQEGEGETEALAARLTALNAEQEHLSEALKSLEQQSAEARERLQARNAERDAAQNQLRERERSVEQARQGAVRLLSESSQLRNQIAQIESYLQSIERDTARLKNEEQAAESDLARLEAARVEFSGKLAGRQLELESIHERRKGVEGSLQEKRASAAETRKKLDALRQEVSRLRARRDSHEEILSHRSYTTETVKRLFSVIEQDHAEGLKPAGVLADFVDLTDPRFERATEEFLHEELEYVVVKQWEDARKGLEVLNANCDGRVTFLVEPNLNADPAAVVTEVPPEPPIGPETGIAGRLSDGLRFTNGLTNAPSALLPRLARCYLAEDRDSASRLSRMYPDLFFLLEDGVCYHGHAVSAGRKTGSGPLALKRELRELSALYEQRHAEFTASQAILDGLEAEIAALTEDLDQLKAEQQRQEKETLILDQEMRKLAEETRRSNQRLSIARVELERIGRDSTAQLQQRDAKALQLEQKESERALQDAAYEEGKAALEGLRQALHSLAEEHSVARVELSTLDERRRGTEHALNRLEQQLRELSSRRSALAAELERLALQRNRLLENNLELDQKAASLAGEAAHFTELVSTLAARESELKDNLALAEEELKILRQQVGEAQEARGQIEVGLVRKQSDLKYLDETCRKDLGVSLAELNPPPPEPVALTAGWLMMPTGEVFDLAGTTLQPDRSITRGEGDVLLAGNEAEPAAEPDELTVAESEEKVVELRKRIEGLGAVNPEAWHEYQEAQQRYDFLNAQRTDLLDSIRDTEKAIHEIDSESRKRFVEAFHAINGHFQEMFRVLFGGGTGEMRLTGEGDALDQGIEIVAQPPGKRLQNVQLLSGGEKALTAVALLMSIFKYQPSPFCILDEVDAPLDEANVGRLANLLKEMAGETQFIVITHAKKTMESADMLYGVTMQEQGVSKLVSVKLKTPAPPPPQPTLQTAARA